MRARWPSRSCSACWAPTACASSASATDGWCRRRGAPRRCARRSRTERVARHGRRWRSRSGTTSRRGGSCSWTGGCCPPPRRDSARSSPSRLPSAVGTSRMHTDARSLDDGAVLEGDLCIVGAGAAGLSVALEWVGAAHRVLLLEGGGFDLEPAMQDLYRGEIVGQPYFPLQAARLHYFGGTTGHWSGFCSTYDAIDFEQRPWVPHSGWPIRREELDPFYARAHRLLDLGPYEYDAGAWARRDPELAALPVDPRVVWTKMWRFSPPTRFGTKYRDAIVGARNVHLYTHANVCEVEANDALTAVRGLRVRTLGGKELVVRARRYVLACSTIQNARLLLASNRQATAGLGNAHDLVGRYFMEHIEMPAAELVLAPPHSARTKLYAFDFGRTKARGELALSAAAQREHGILN